MRYEAALNPQPVNPNPLLPQTARIPSDKEEWQPRLGFSWDVTGSARTILRASAGIFYARTPMLLLNQAFNSNGNPDVGVSFTLNAAQIRQAQAAHPEFVYPFVPDTSSARNASFFTASGIAGLKPDASFFDPNFKNPRSYNTGIGVEHLIRNNLAVSLDWVHANTVHLERIRDSQFTDKPIIAGAPLPRNTFRQPNLLNVDLRVSKSFKVYEHHKLEMIFDMFNLTNKKNFFYNVSTNESTTTALGSRWGTGGTPVPTFRTIRLADGSLNRGGATVGSPFQLQVALRYRF